jgi:rhodanese-related sulfurtransferase
MSVAVNPVRKTDIQKLLKRAQAGGKSASEPFAGTLDPAEAWKLVDAGEAVLIDVRTEEELAFVGRVPNAIHVPWLAWPGMRPNPDFLSDLEDEMPDKAMPVLFLCRSGQRSAAAAAAATAAGYDHAYNIAEGFEGNLDDEQHRGTLGGWRHRGLPWAQS